MDATFGRKLGRKLKPLIRRAGFNQTTLAEHLGTWQSVVNRWVNGKAVPEPATVLRIARAVGTTMDYLLDDEADEPPAAAVSPKEMELITRVRQIGLDEAWDRLLLAPARPKASMTVTRVNERPDGPSERPKAKPNQG